MNMRDIGSHAILFTAAIAATLGGCSTKQPKLDRNDRPNASLRIDARPGHYESFRSQLESGEDAKTKTFRVAIQAEKLQPSDEWLPAIVVCMDGKSSGPTTCLHVAASRDGTVLTPKLSERQTSKDEWRTTSLPFDLHPKDTHYLDVAFTNRVLRFILDDRTVHERPMPTLPEEYSVSCSSMVCSVDIYYPFIRFLP
jgi:hypothetical protein